MMLCKDDCPLCKLGLDPDTFKEGDTIKHIKSGTHYIVKDVDNYDNTILLGDISTNNSIKWDYPKHYMKVRR